MPPPTAATPSAPSHDEAEEQEERAAALAGGIWGAEHGRTLQTLAGSGGASSASASVSPLLPATLKRPTTQPARPDRPTRPARGIDREDGRSAPVAAAPVAVVSIERERSALARTLEPQRVVETPKSVAGKGAWRVRNWLICYGLGFGCIDSSMNQIPCYTHTHT